MITFHIINGCLFGMELVDGKYVDPNSNAMFLVIDLFLLRLVINI